METAWIFFFSLFLALSDEFGRKPLILLPLVGFFTGYLLNTIHYSLLSSLPLEFFYTDNVSAFFGGMPIYYLGIYRQDLNLDGTYTIRGGVIDDDGKTL